MTTAAEIAARYGAAVAPGCVVQKIPRGHSSMPKYIWDGVTNALVLDMPRGDAREHGKREWQRGISFYAGRGRHIAKMKQAAAERREAAKVVILEMHERGLTPTEIVAAGVGGQAFVYSLVKELGIAPNRVNANYGPDIPDRVMEMTAQGFGAPQIGVALGITSHQVKHIRSKHARLSRMAAE